MRAGVPRWLVRRELEARRWQRGCRQTLVLHNGPLAVAELRAIAVLGTCERAALDGVTALQAAGLTGLSDTRRHVIVPRGSRPRRLPDVTVHESRRFREEDVLDGGLRRTRPAVAALHAALWAVTDRQAQLFILMAIQQRLATPEQIAEALAAVLRHPRRRMLRRLLVEVAGGVESLGELDIAEDFRRRGLPEPERQVIRRRPSGTSYLDCALPAYRLVLEIDGAGHEQPEQALSDLLRDLAVTADGDRVVRLPLKLYRLDPDRVLDGIEALLRARGWAGPAAA